MKIDKDALFKVTGPSGACCNGGKGSWLLPNEAGDNWMPQLTNIVPCSRGYHVCRWDQLVAWLNDEIWIIERHPDSLVLMDNSDKMVTDGPVRLVSLCSNWNEYTARLFACDCAEHVLHLYEKLYPNDNRVRTCIETSRRFANGEATEKELDAARDAAGYASDAARSAASYAASYASESKWQTRLLLQYLKGAKP